MNESEPLKKYRKRRDAVKTRGESLIWDKSEGYLFIAQAAAGMKVA